MPEYESWVEYRDVPGFEDKYKIGSDGTVWSCLRTGKSQGRKIRPWRQLKLSENQGNRYLCVALSRPGIPIARVGVHVLLARVFIGSPLTPGQQVRHLDGNCQNNDLDNLAWGTPKENSEDRVRHKTQYAILSAEQIPEIRRMYSEGMSSATVAKHFSVHSGTIAAIVGGRTWTHIPGEISTDRPSPKSKPPVHLGENNRQSKLTVESVLKIRALHSQGSKRIDLMKQFGVGATTIDRVIRRQTWDHV